MSERSHDKKRPLNCDPDAQRWAQEFNEILKKNQGIELDEGWMISWFANAIMCGEDTYRWRQEEKAAQVSATAPTICGARLVSVRRQGSSVGPVIACSIRTDDGVVVNLTRADGDTEVQRHGLHKF